MYEETQMMVMMKQIKYMKLVHTKYCKSLVQLCEVKCRKNLYPSSLKYNVEWNKLYEIISGDITVNNISNVIKIILLLLTVCVFCTYEDS